MVIAPILKAVNRGVSTSIGLVGEKYYDRKDRKTALDEQERQNSRNPITELVNPAEPGEETANDERIWALDDISDVPDYETSQARDRPHMERTVSALVHEVATTSEAHRNRNDTPRASLPYPIVIPQRRPGSKARGWARAYPPDLEALGVEQDTFLRFLQNFEDAQQASPWLKAVYVAGSVVGVIPGHITLAVSISVTITAGTAIELQSRYKANSFLDQMNRDFFMPLGLYAMVLMCKDTPSKAGEVEFGMEEVNMDTVKQITKWGLPTENGNSVKNSTRTKLLRPIRLTSRSTTANTMPLQIAPLIYPGLEDLIERPQINRNETFKERLMRNKGFVADYFDRRARAEYAGNNPNSALTKASGDMPEFRNRFADPNHPCNNGHLVSLATGGNYVVQPAGRRGGMLRQKGPDGKLLPKVKEEPMIRGPITLVTNPIKKILSPNILYLTIVRMPTEDEMSAARAELRVDQKSWKDMLASYMQANRLPERT
ncbi:hypothetical protein DE146DRAFT_176006 [Phaeosphaeria sp. MPI-PUGE-AT-0046c]|nr:hypothetical protein DE146DRAFT_176006 [Phaeosphaeria sp. MPI-PUGE-AT-0046c]